MNEPQPKAETFWQRMILPEEERRRQLHAPIWNGSYRWFQSPNIIDLWHYRGDAERQRIIEFMWSRQLSRWRAR